MISTKKIIKVFNAKGISSSYSFIDDKNEDFTRMQLFYLNDGDDPSRVVMNDESPSNKIDSVCIDAYKNQRNLDVAKFFPLINKLKPKEFLIDTR